MMRRAFFLVLFALGALLLADVAGSSASAHDVHGMRHAPATGPSGPAPELEAVAADPVSSDTADGMAQSLQHKSGALAMPRHVESRPGTKAGGCLPESDGCAEGCCSTVCHLIGLTSAAAPLGGPHGRSVLSGLAVTSLAGEGPASISRPPNTAF